MSPLNIASSSTCHPPIEADTNLANPVFVIEALNGPAAGVLIVLADIAPSIVTLSPTVTEPVIKPSPSNL